MQELDNREAPEIDPTRLTDAHRSGYLDALKSASPDSGLVAVDPDTSMGPFSLQAARRAAGAVVEATDQLLAGNSKRAFCAVRPPGHHAEADVAMGFCFYNSIALGAQRALADPAIDRVAVLDFDVHHGNGTVDIFKDQPDVLVCSSFQHPYYPHRYADIERDNIVNTPLSAGSGSRDFRYAVERDWLPALATHQPQMIFVSAGFDAHFRDHMSHFNLTETDYEWVTREIVRLATAHADGRIVSVLEGGYDLPALGASVSAHLRVLLGI